MVRGDEVYETAKETVERYLAHIPCKDAQEIRQALEDHQATF